MFVSTAVPILLATQTPPFSEQLKLVASLGHRWMWPPCELPHGSNLVQVKVLISCVPLSATLWTVAHQAPLSEDFSMQKCWSRLPCTSPGDLLDPGIELESPALQADSLPSELSRKPF